ncbi:hypothetical protein CEUSTIGMA_g13125.t1 [Chlamydomonas eustigma]|uniref:Uncharacterized protein n=1 Tax=Chlamydomonas eustigma TaxID=1157962 RepID=A0A250XRJ9_9CHLO|nr:hypothetical protein CEUSTIGMA_g13125.t1 [Chlamydomonas eustigma]|eukprot:GAX85711.1 hypothetical protein CEUSTIGMA_g13125.t1 [Chlamydomonas eustigma]
MADLQINLLNLASELIKDKKLEDLISLQGWLSVALNAWASYQRLVTHVTPLVGYLMADGSECTLDLSGLVGHQAPDELMQHRYVRVLKCNQEVTAAQTRYQAFAGFDNAVWIVVTVLCLNILGRKHGVCLHLLLAAGWQAIVWAACTIGQGRVYADAVWHFRQRHEEFGMSAPADAQEQAHKLVQLKAASKLEDRIQALEEVLKSRRLPELEFGLPALPPTKGVARRKIKA